MPSPLLPPLTALGEVPSPDSESDGEVEQDQLVFTLELPSCPQLQLFETVFNTGKPLSGYCQDDPLWLLLAEVASPCTNCVRTLGKCKVLPNSPRCTNCTSKKTCSLGKILRYRYFARRCNQDLAYSRRFLELNGTPAHQSTWGIPLSAWHKYDAALHARTSSTSTLLELNMLDERDTVEADQQELREFLALQQGEAAVAAKCKRDRSPLPVAGPSRKKIPCGSNNSGLSSPHPVGGSPESSGRCLLFPPRSPSLLPFPNGGTSRGPADAKCLPLLVPPWYPAISLLTLTVLRISILLLGFLCWSTSALRDTSHALESQQREVEQLRSSSREFLQHQAEYHRIINQFNTLDRTLSGPSDQSLPERFQKVEEELRLAKRHRDDVVGKLSTSSCKVSELTTALLYQHGITDEANALSTR
ncbi:hypothetical protein EV359DRAFT_80245 [Lentinula novae-zelandiae]|nr:hypothetical protein EV359DRAFT_80245 [Lentinula novae-zelandiae]